MATILIVEDERIVADDIEKSLEDSGYTVFYVSSKEDAIKKAEEVDLILMDIALKGELDGIEAAQYIYSRFDVPIVFLTAHADENTLKKAKAAQPYGYIVKPFEDKELRATIEMALHRHKMEGRLKESSKWLKKKIDERSKRIEVLLNAKQNLQEEKTWERGLMTIAECMVDLGFERCGIFLVNPFKRTLDYHFGEGIDLTVGQSVSLKDTDYFGVRCIVEKRTIYVREYNPHEGKNIVSDSHSFVWVPIIVQDDAFAALAACTAKSNAITNEDVKDLEILAGMCGVFIDRTRQLIEPVPEERMETEITHWLNPSEGYIVLEKEAEKSFEIFLDLVTHGIPGFVVSREHPQKQKSKYHLVKTPVMWLSRFDTEDTINPDSLSKLVYIVTDFTRRSTESVILMDGLEYLISQLGFDTTLTHLQELKDIVVMYNSRLIIPLHREVLSQKEYSTLEKEFKVLQ